MKESNGGDDEIENAIVKSGIVHAQKGFVEVGDPRPPQHPNYSRFLAKNGVLKTVQ